MAPLDPKAVICEECLAIVRELRLAASADADKLRTRFEETAASAGQDANAFAVAWLASVKKMSSEEIRTLSRAHHPHLLDARKRWQTHERETGHHLPYFGSLVPWF